MSATEPTPFDLGDADERKPERRPHVLRGRRANDLAGATWTRYSISVWSDVRKSTEERTLGHPAMFPAMLASRLIECFTTKDDRVILDPFAGVGTTPIAAESLGKIGIGIEISPEYVEKARGRPAMLWSGEECGSAGQRILHVGDAMKLLDFVRPDSVDMVITSPPYWDILLRDRTADHRETRDYGGAGEDLGKIHDYGQFLLALRRVFEQVFVAMRPGAYCCVVVMDLRKKGRFYPYHSDVADFMQEVGFIYDDVIIWDRRHEYNSLRPLGYPSKFRINKTHEFILIFQKPRGVNHPLSFRERG